MKQTGLYIILMLCFGSLSFAQIGQSPKLIFKHYEYNFGTLDYNEEATHDFIFKNISDSVLIITNVKAKCGCAAMDWIKSPIKKNRKGSIKISYDTSIPGKFSKSIYVFTNLSNQPIKLLIQGNVKQAKNQETN
ncbi:MAG: DUF1573 domain-containing protein [Bacteroidota bacterium]|nr:DUF1573 domain-containing protein [Bacteroidota bacterium]